MVGARETYARRAVFLERGARVDVVDVAVLVPAATIDDDLLRRRVTQLVAQVGGAATAAGAAAEGVRVEAERGGRLADGVARLVGLTLTLTLTLTSVGASRAEEERRRVARARRHQMLALAPQR